MDTTWRLHERLRRARWLPWAGIACTLLILAGTITLGTLQLRQKIRAQIVSRDADILHGVAQMVQVTQDGDNDLGGALENLPDQIAVALQISELNTLNGVIAARLFATNGHFAAALPSNLTETRLSEADLRQLERLKPISRYHSEVTLANLFLPGTTAFSGRNQSASLLEVTIPLHRQKQPVLLGAIQFLIDGQGIAAQFAVLDRNLIAQGSLAFVAGGIIIVVTLSWAFRRLRRANLLLTERTRRLQRANEELALSAKTSAVGAITAHLVHGLSSPLAGVQDFVASRAREEGPEPDWHDLLENTTQMQELIGEIVRVLGEEQGVDCYEISFAELAELLRSKAAAAADAAGVQVQNKLLAQGFLANREANLVLLILENLLKNAIQATPRGGRVYLKVQRSGEDVEFRMEDEGPGVPAELQSNLFKPCRSSKRGGHGIGLAICRQLAHHLEARLELRSSGPEGSVFSLRLSRARLCQNSTLDPERVVR